MLGRLHPKGSLDSRVKGAAGLESPGSAAMTREDLHGPSSKLVRNEESTMPTAPWQGCRLSCGPLRASLGLTLAPGLRPGVRQS